MGHKWWKSNFKVKIFPSKDIAEVAGSYILCQNKHGLTLIHLSSSAARRRYIQLCCSQTHFSMQSGVLYIKSLDIMDYLNTMCGNTFDMSWSLEDGLLKPGHCSTTHVIIFQKTFNHYQWTKMWDRWIDPVFKLFTSTAGKNVNYTWTKCIIWIKLYWYRPTVSAPVSASCGTIIL